MLKLTKTGIGLLTKQYRSVLRKCLLLNLELFSAIIIGTIPNAKAGFTIYYNRNVSSPTDQDYAKKSIYAYDVSDINASISLATARELNDALNYYYTFRENERVEVIDSASFFQKNFLTLQKVDLQSKNPTHLGAFAKCDEVCPQPSERFISSLSQEQMFKNDASVDAGTSRHCLRQFGDVVADLLKNTVAKSLRIYEFMNEEVCHA